MKRKSNRNKILFVFGTRPEAIKLAPLILRMKRDGRLRPVVAVTAQHREMLDQVLRLFSIRPRYDLDIMRKGQSLFDVTSRGIAALEHVVEKERPSMVVVQGDTATTFLGGLAAFYHRVPVAHVEAGLRTDDKYSPFPEEIYRRLTTHVADIHFAPTRDAKENLLREGIPERSVYVTGNTSVDALLYVKGRIESSAAKSVRLAKRFPFLAADDTVVLVTAHRRESFGGGFRNICAALKEIAQKRPDVKLVYPVHLNPNVRRPVRAMLGGIKNVHLIEPLEYEPFVRLMMMSSLILTDSGGIQEEAPSLGKPVLVMREKTERKEAVRTGTARLVGTKKALIVSEALGLLGGGRDYKEMVRRMGRGGRKNPYGDGRASERILKVLIRHAESR